MLIICVIDNGNNRWNAKKKSKKDKCDRGYSESMRAKGSCCAFKLGFLELICQASLF